MSLRNVTRLIFPSPTLLVSPVVYLTSDVSPFAPSTRAVYDWTCDRNFIQQCLVLKDAEPGLRLLTHFALFSTAHHAIPLVILFTWLTTPFDTSLPAVLQAVTE